jgi:hypothetical protein
MRRERGADTYIGGVRERERECVWFLKLFSVFSPPEVAKLSYVVKYKCAGRVEWLLGGDEDQKVVSWMHFIGWLAPDVALDKAASARRWLAQSPSVRPSSERWADGDPDRSFDGWMIHSFREGGGLIPSVLGNVVPGRTISVYNSDPHL